jgi:hypothetical protein
MPSGNGAKAKQKRERNQKKAVSFVSLLLIMSIMTWTDNGDDHSNKQPKVEVLT